MSNIRFPVVICRSPGDWRKDLFDATKINNPSWGSCSGGVHRYQSGSSIYGYIPYDDVPDGVACSGRHSFYGHDAKMCICKSHNRYEEFKIGYMILEQQANIKYHKKTRPQTARRIIVLLALNEKMSRSELITRLINETYSENAIAKALEKLKTDNSIEEFFDEEATTSYLKLKDNFGYFLDTK